MKSRIGELIAGGFEGFRHGFVVRFSWLVFCYSFPDTRADPVG
ncbi:hypothetical protein Hsw_1907 [Hymenobacter swuensis DY53]|uniref:Uncharacterized protein n=1 Tax=Hymenobacter swuensis DY53 TaxID=1227739 RepID=W8F0I1_9BACT|nr:hypothetical protein Hsw_1907 [Hymenobacter swuensis DY53]